MNIWYLEPNDDDAVIAHHALARAFADLSFRHFPSRRACMASAPDERPDSILVAAGPRCAEALARIDALRADSRFAEVPVVLLLENPFPKWMHGRRLPPLTFPVAKDASFHDVVSLLQHLASHEFAGSTETRAAPAAG